MTCAFEVGAGAVIVSRPSRGVTDKNVVRIGDVSHLP
jgi:hypothetical protein